MQYGAVLAGLKGKRSCGTASICVTRPSTPLLRCDERNRGKIVAIPSVVACKQT